MRSFRKNGQYCVRTYTRFRQFPARLPRINIFESLIYLSTVNLEPLNRERLRLIYSPRWTKPVLAMPGETVPMVLADSCPRDISVRVGDGVDSVALRMGECPPVKGTADFRGLNVRLPDDLAAGLYDLHLVSGTAPIASEPNCLWVVPEDRARITFAHISDLHVGNPRPSDREHRIDNLFRYLDCDVKPAFILNTGDLINRYIHTNGAKEILRPDIVCDHIHRAREIILRYRIPHFLTPGNHDVAFPYIYREWRRMMGGPWDKPNDDYAFSPGGMRFIGLDRSVMYDGDHQAYDNRLSAARHRWLRTELESLPANRPALIFCHYDYHGELKWYLQRYPVLKVCYGHTAKSCLDPEHADRDGGLCPYICQVFEWSANDGLRLCAKMKLADFETAHANAQT